MRPDRESRPIGGEAGTARYTVAEAAAVLGITERSTRKCIKAGTVAAEQAEGRWWVLLPAPSEGGPVVGHADSGGPGGSGPVPVQRARRPVLQNRTVGPRLPGPEQARPLQSRHWWIWCGRCSGRMWSWRGRWATCRAVSTRRRNRHASSRMRPSKRNQSRRPVRCRPGDPRHSEPDTLRTYPPPHAAIIPAKGRDIAGQRAGVQELFNTGRQLPASP